MRSSRANVIARDLGTLFQAGVLSGQSDADLLDRFVTNRDDAAFAALVSRYAPMVLRICRRALDDPRDADDAFQTTFLVLVDKAESIRRPESLESWLRGVSRKVSARMRTDAQYRKRRERSIDTLIVASHHNHPTDPERSARRAAEINEIRKIVRDELDSLPDDRRLVLTLCYLDGLTQSEAAVRLGWKEGTVKSRLARGREQLRKRLVRRGIALSTNLLVAALAEEAKAIVVPRKLLESTTAAAVRHAVKRTVIGGTGSVKAYLLMKGTFSMMSIAKMTMILVSIAAVVATGAALGTVANQVDAEEKALKPPDGSRSNDDPSAATFKSVKIAEKTPKSADHIDLEGDFTSPGTYLFNLNMLEYKDQIATARADLKRFKNRVKWLREMVEKKSAPKALLDAEEKIAKDAEIDFEQAQKNLYRIDSVALKNQPVAAPEDAKRKIHVVEIIETIGGGLRSKELTESSMTEALNAVKTIPDLNHKATLELWNVLGEALIKQRQAQYDWDIQIIRRSVDREAPELILPVYLKAIEKGDDSTNYIVMPGDRIIARLKHKSIKANEEPKVE
jgi:RNA polymerase sigma factor (sigma-70 family)